MPATGLAPNVSKELGGFLRYWREVRGASQLALSLDAGISQRQISFIESGRSVPGRQTLLNLAQSLEVPLRERNMLLLSAGYAPMYSEAGWSTQEMARVSSAAHRVLQQHEPFSALVMDRYWNVLQVSRSTLHFFNLLHRHDGPHRAAQYAAPDLRSSRATPAHRQLGKCGIP